MDMERMRQLISLSQDGDPEARNLLVEENLPLVHSVAKRFINRGLDYDDLVQIGCLGLLKAISGFDLNFTVRFSTYAVPMIMGEIRQNLRKSSTLQIARSTKKLASDAIRTKDTLAQQYGRSPTIGEIATELQVSAEEVVTALEAVAPVHSLQADLDQHELNPRKLQDQLGVVDKYELVSLRQALEKLEPEERKLILLRYFAEKSQTEVAKNLGISQGQLSRIEARIVRQLRHEV